MAERIDDISTDRIKALAAEAVQDSTMNEFEVHVPVEKIEYAEDCRKVLVNESFRSKNAGDILIAEPMTIDDLVRLEAFIKTKEKHGPILIHERTAKEVATVYAKKRRRIVEAAVPEKAITLPWEQDEYEPVRGAGVFTDNGKSIAAFEMVDKESENHLRKWTVEEISYIKEKGLGFEYGAKDVRQVVQEKLIIAEDPILVYIPAYCFWKTWPAFMLYTVILATIGLIVLSLVSDNS